MGATRAEEIGQIVTGADQIIIDVNDSICGLLHKDRADLIGTHALSFTFAGDIERNRLLLDRLAHHGQSFAITKRYVRHDHSLVWVRNHVTTVGDGKGARLICATCEPASRPFGSDAITRGHALARHLCNAIVLGKAVFGSDIISVPAAEALLWLYRAELEGDVLTVDDVAHRTSLASTTTTRWLNLLIERSLIECTTDMPLSPVSTLRISRDCEVALDGLLANLAALGGPAEPTQTP